MSVAMLKAKQETNPNRQNLKKALEACWVDDITFDASNPVVRLHEPTFGPDDIMALTESMLDKRITAGPRVKEFEKAYCDMYGYNFGVMNNSGSSANLLAIAALSNPAFPNQLKPGDEVIVPALSWSTTVWPLVQHGLVPVVVDIDPQTLNMDPKEIEKAISPKTRAVMLVHVYGNPCDMDAITSVCDKHNLLLIEDSCESMGATYKGKAVGSFGLLGTFSFYYSHHVTTLEGGITVTKDTEVDDLMRVLRSHGWHREVKDPSVFEGKYPELDPRFIFINSGYNLRISDVQAAMGLVQLGKLQDYVKARQTSAAYWKDYFSNYADWVYMQKEQEGGESSWFGIVLSRTEKAPFTIKELREYLESNNIETRPVICGNITKQPAMKYYTHRAVGDLQNSTDVMHNSFSFGNHQFVDENARDYIKGVFESFFKKFK